MKRLTYFLLVSMAFAFSACSGDDDNTVVASFENKPVTNNYFKSTSQTASGYYFKDTFTDNDKMLTFDHYYASWGWAGFTYTNSSDTKTANSTASVVGAAKVGTMYIGAYGSSYTPAKLQINDVTKYGIVGCWVSNSVYAYNGMTIGDSQSTKFKSGSWYTITATGYADSEMKTAVGLAQTIYTAKYKSDTDTPSKVWLWFDLSSLKDAKYIVFTAASSDSGQYGMNTDANFCLDGITLSEK